MLSKLAPNGLFAELPADNLHEGKGKPIALFLYPV